MKKLKLDWIESPWPIYIYFVLTAVESVKDIFALHWKDGFSAIVSASLALIAGSLLKTSLLWGDSFKRIFGALFSILLIAGAHRASYDFTIVFFSHTVDGVLWCYLGVLIGFLFTSKRNADISE